MNRVNEDEMAPGRNPTNGSGDEYQYEYEPAEKRRRTHRSSPRSSSAAVGSDRDVANTSTMPPLRQQGQLAGTPSVLWRSRRPSDDSLEDYFARVASERDATAFPSYSGSPAQQLGSSDPDPSGALIPQLLGDNPAGDFLAAFAVDIDELARVPPPPNLGLDVSAMPGPPNVQQQSVMSPQSSGSEADEGWEPYYSHGLSESEDETPALTMPPVDLTSIPTMDMAETGRLPRTAPGPALSFHEMVREAERLEPSITQNELDEFFAGEVVQEFIQRRPLAFLRALELHGVSKLSDLTWVPKLRGKRRVDMQLLATDLSLLPVDYFRRAYGQVRRYHKENERAPDWMYTVIEKLSLNEGRKPLRVPDLQTPQTAGAVGPSPALSFDEMLREAERLEPSISRTELDGFFGGKTFGEFIQRKLLALFNALRLHHITKLSDLTDVPKSSGGGRVNREELSIKLKLKPRYFAGVYDCMVRYHKKHEAAPDWMYKIMERFSLSEGRKPLRPIEDENPSREVGRAPQLTSSAKQRDIPKPSNVGVTNQCDTLSYSILIERAKALQSSLDDSEIRNFFGDLRNKNDRRKLLSLIRVLRDNGIEKLKNVIGVPFVRSGHVNALAIGDTLKMPENYFGSLRAMVSRYHRKNKSAPDWVYDVLETLSVDDNLQRPQAATQ